MNMPPFRAPLARVSLVAWGNWGNVGFKESDLGATDAKPTEGRDVGFNMPKGKATRLRKESTY